MIHLDQIRFSYQQKNEEIPVFSDLSLELSSNRSYGLVGRSGCGKTTLLYLLAQILEPQQGRILWDLPGAQNPDSVSIGFMTQRSSLFPWKTSIQNVMLGLSFRRDVNQKQKQSIAQGVLNTLGLSHLGNRYPRELSGGQAQRVSLARTLVAEPDLLLMDEPTSQLDEMTREEIQDSIRKLHLAQPRTLIFVTHSVEEAVYLGQTILVMDEGQIIGNFQNPSFGQENARMQEGFYQVCRQVRGCIPANQVPKSQRVGVGYDLNK